MNKSIFNLSLGEKQRVAIASAMISNKDLIVFDGPTSGLDYYHMMQVGQLLNYLKEQGKCVVVITHDEELSLSWCDYIILVYTSYYLLKPKEKSKNTLFISIF